MVIVHILAWVNPDFPIPSLKVFTSLLPGKLQEKKNIEKMMNFYLLQWSYMPCYDAGLHVNSTYGFVVGIPC